MLRYAFRLHRWGMIGFAVVFFIATYAQASAFIQLAGKTAASRATFAHDMTVLAAQLSYLLPAPFRLDTLAGYVQWRAYGTLPLVISVWAVAAAAGAVRGDEEKQLVDNWLASRVSRSRLVAIRLAAFAVAAAVTVLAAGLGTIVGAASSDPVDVARLAGKSLSLLLVAVTLFALCYLVAQLTASVRGAQGAGAAVAVVLYLLDVPSRSQPSLDALAWVSPYKWYEATNVLASGGHLDVAGVALSIGLILAAGVLAALAFARRDIRGPLFARRHGEAAREGARSPSPALSRPVARLLYRQRWIIIGWAVITVVLAVFMIGIARSVVDSIINLPGMRAVMTHNAAGDPYRAFIAVFWFSIAELLLAGFAVHLVSTWGSDDTEGILASVLSTPQHRWAVVVERAAMALLAIAAVVAVGSLTAAGAAAAFGHGLDAGGVLQASWLLIPFALTFAAVGAIGSVRWPRAVVGILGVLALLSYLIAELAPLLNWPTWAIDLSVFNLYGTPLLSGIFWNGLWVMLAVVAAGFGLATLLMQRREVGT